jgi:pyruvate formate lyase activating enzyme
MRERVQVAPGVVRGAFSHLVDGGRRVQCDLCPRECTLQDGQRGFCFVRQARDGGIVLTSYGRASGFCIDPIEKKPLNHFYPGSSVLSFGTAGCNLGCKFCQNWDISKAKEMDRLMDFAMPDAIAEAAVAHGCKSVAFTYNDPVIFVEYASDCAQAAHTRGIKTVAVTAGYISPAARPTFFEHIDAANVDLKGFTEDFYETLCFASLAPVLDTLRWLKRESQVWLEITTLLIPGKNDSPDEIARMTDWLVDNVGPETPLHFTAFHPDFKLTELTATPVETLQRAREQALRGGLRHVYTGNISDRTGQSTYCAGCGKLLIERDGYRILGFEVGADGKCHGCGKVLAGYFDAEAGSFGARRLRVVP